MKIYDLTWLPMICIKQCNPSPSVRCKMESLVPTLVQQPIPPIYTFPNINVTEPMTFTM